MSPSEVAASLNDLLDIHQPAFIWGPPGIGKSDIVAQVAKTRKIELEDVRTNTLDPVDFRGFPMPDAAKNEMSWLRPDFLPTKGKGILFLDEFNSAAPAIMAAGYQLMLNRRIGKYKLPPGWDVIAAGNRAGDRAVVHTMPSALANRMVHIDLEVSLPEWIVWAEQHNIATAIRSYVRFQPQYLHFFDPTTNPRAFPTPRSWAFVDKILSKHMPPNREFELIKGTIGEGVAGHFVAHQRVEKDLPKLEDILSNPTTLPAPQSPSVMHAVVTMLGSHVTTKNFGKMLQYIERIGKEFQILFVKDSIRKDDTIGDTPEFSAWSIKNREVMM